MRLMAALPTFILRGVSDVLYFLLYYIIAYRKAVTSGNLQKAFPEKTAKELLLLKKKFYHHLADIIIENIVIQYYSKRRLEKMFQFENPELIDAYFETGRPIILITGHYGNWEWASPLSYTFNHKLLAVYKPLKNPYFDKAYIKSRTRFGGEAVPMRRIGRVLFQYNEKKIATLTGMVGDQRPIRQQTQFWTSFLDQQTAVFTGSEKLAKKFNAVVVFMEVRKTQRGKYLASIKLITDTPRQTAEFEITEKHTRMLEALILEDPAYWLWSHRRWKISYEQWLEMEGSTKQKDTSGKK